MKGALLPPPSSPGSYLLSCNKPLLGKKKKKKKKKERSSLVAQWVKDLALSLLRLWYSCGAGLIPGSGAELPHATSVAKKKKKKKIFHHILHHTYTCVYVSIYSYT